jgi:putative membrane protein
MGVETTLLAWIRTGMALMGFGFVVARFGIFLKEIAAAEMAQGHIRHHRGTGFSLVFGGVLILLGMAVNLIAGWLNWRFVRRLPKGGPDLPPTLPLGLILSVLLALVGLAMAVYLAAIEI